VSLSRIGVDVEAVADGVTLEFGVASTSGLARTSVGLIRVLAIVAREVLEIARGVLEIARGVLEISTRGGPEILGEIRICGCSW
jgi:hypothetical protein